MIRACTRTCTAAAWGGGAVAHVCAAGSVRAPGELLWTTMQGAVSVIKVFKYNDAHVQKIGLPDPKSIPFVNQSPA